MPTVLVAPATRTMTPVPATATTAPRPTPAVEEGGQLWLPSLEPSGYVIIDPQTGVSRVVPAPKDCRRLLPRSTKTLCSDQNQHVRILDLVTGQTQPLPIGPVSWFDWTPNGRFVFYETAPEAWVDTISAFDLANATSTVLSTGVPAAQSQPWANTPVLSANGQHLVVARALASGGNRAFEIQRGPYHDRQIGPDQANITADLAWSPTANRFILGATSSMAPEVGYGTTNLLYLVDVAAGDTKLLAQAPDGTVFSGFGHNPIWSADGRRAVVENGQRLCIIDASMGTVECGNGLSQAAVPGTLAWSPSGRNIAFVAVRTHDLIVYDVASQAQARLRQGVEADWVDWR